MIFLISFYNDILAFPATLFFFGVSLFLTPQDPFYSDLGISSQFLRLIIHVLQLLKKILQER